MIHRQLFPLFQHIVKNLPVKMETLVGLSSSYALHTEGVPSGPVCGYAPRRETRDARQRSGTPIRSQRRETSKARRDPPGFARITLQWLKMNHSPGAGQAGRRRPRAPRVDQQTAKQDGPSRSRDRPTLTRYGGRTQRREAARTERRGAFSGNHCSRNPLHLQGFSDTVRMSTVRETRRTP